MKKTDTNSHDQDSEIRSLKEEIAILEGVQSAMPDPYYVRDMDYNIVIWPAAIAKLTGYSEAEARKLKCYQMFKACVCPPGSACPTQNCIKVKQFLRDVSVDVYHKSGKTIHTLVSNAGVYNEKGEPIGAVEVVKDNTVLQTCMDSIGIMVKDIDSSSDDLSEISNQINAISEKVSGTAQDTMNSTKSSVQASMDATQKVEQSIKYADDVQLKMQKINDSMNFLADKVSEQEQKTENIIKSVKTIQSISYETDLLAINAAIQAVHAGEAGKGFKVVAEGIKELSQNSSEAALVITQNIQETIDLVKETRNALNSIEKEVQTGTKNISELLAFIENIDISMKELSSTISNIEGDAELTHKLGGEQNGVALEIGSTSRKMDEIAKNLSQEFDRVVKAIKHLDMG